MYNKAFVTDKSTFLHNIAHESLWGNKFVTKKVKKKKNVLFLRNWIRSGIRQIHHLKFTAGILDEANIYNKVQQKKQHIYRNFTSQTGTASL